MPKIITYEEVKNVIESKGCKLLSNKYEDTKSKLKLEQNMDSGQKHLH